LNVVSPMVPMESSSPVPQSSSNPVASQESSSGIIITPDSDSQSQGMRNTVVMLNASVSDTTNFNNSHSSPTTTTQVTAATNEVPVVRSFHSVGDEIVYSLNKYLLSRGRHPKPRNLSAEEQLNNMPVPNRSVLAAVMTEDRLNTITLDLCARFRRRCLEVDNAGIAPIFEQVRRDLQPLGLHLPLSFEHFKMLIEATYEMMGGRDIIETGTNAIKGCKNVDGINTMYGGVKEELVDDIVARTRLTRDSRFLDIGSGIGQSCIQVAATVGCSVAGVEIDHSRCKASRNLLVAFNCLLIEVRCLLHIYNTS
jgi:hypothetical protein